MRSLHLQRPAAFYAPWRRQLWRSISGSQRIGARHVACSSRQPFCRRHRECDVSTEGAATSTSHLHALSRDPCVDIISIITILVWRHRVDDGQESSCRHSATRMSERATNNGGMGGGRQAELFVVPGVQTTNSTCNQHSPNEKRTISGSWRRIKHAKNESKYLPKMCRVSAC